MRDHGGSTTGKHRRLIDGRVQSATPQVLVVDDNRDVSAAIIRMLNVLGFGSSAATSGDAAVALVVAERPVAILIDLCLPDLSGWELARRIRALELERQPRLVAITGLTDSVFRIRSMAAGFDEHLTKPIAADELKRVLAMLV